MAKCHKLYELCNSCNGTGIDGTVEGGICLLCGGTKLKLTGYTTEEYFDIPEVE
jgi:hypothetical protein